jgi:hypothetical protein
LACVVFITNYSSVGGNIHDDSETLLITDFMNINIKPTQSSLLPLLEAVEALPLLPSLRRSHCSNCAAVEALPLLDVGLRRPARRPEEIRQQRPTASTSMGVDEQGPIWAPIFFLKNDFECRLGTADTKNDLFLYPKNSIRADRYKK